MAQTGEPALVPDVSQDPRFDHSFDQHSGFHTRSILAVPIRIKDEIIGVLEVINKLGAASFDREDLGLFQAFASSVSVALENAQLFERTRAMAEDLPQRARKRTPAVHREGEDGGLHPETRRR